MKIISTLTKGHMKNMLMSDALLFMTFEKTDITSTTNSGLAWKYLLSPILVLQPYPMSSFADALVCGTISVVPLG